MKKHFISLAFAVMVVSSMLLYYLLLNEGKTESVKPSLKESNSVSTALKSPVSFENESAKNQELAGYKLNKKSETKDPDTGEIITTEDAIVSKVVETGKIYLFDLTPDRVTMVGEINEKTIISKVEFYERDEKGNIAGFTIGPGEVKDVQTLKEGAKVRLVFKGYGAEVKSVEIEKIVIY